MGLTSKWTDMRKWCPSISALLRKVIPCGPRWTKVGRRLSETILGWKAQVIYLIGEFLWKPYKARDLVLQKLNLRLSLSNLWKITHREVVEPKFKSVLCISHHTTSHTRGICQNLSKSVFQDLRHLEEMLVIFLVIIQVHGQANENASTKQSILICFIFYLKKTKQNKPLGKNFST